MFAVTEFLVKLLYQIKRTACMFCCDSVTTKLNAGCLFYETQNTNFQEFNIMQFSTVILINISYIVYSRT